MLKNGADVLARRVSLTSTLRSVPGCRTFAQRREPALRSYRSSSPRTMIIATTLSALAAHELNQRATGAAQILRQPA